MSVDRRSFLRSLLTGATVTAAGLILPDPIKTYFFLKDNPLAPPVQPLSLNGIPWYVDVHLDHTTTFYLSRDQWNSIVSIVSKEFTHGNLGSHLNRVR
jgi:hypothetical protein